MSWFRIDDGLHDHRKARRAGKAAMGVWLLAGSWCAFHGTDGFVPANVLPRWGNRTDARKLVDAGLWTEAERDGEQGWTFHDWTFFNPPAIVSEAKRVKERESGLLGNHKRWHESRGITDPDCQHCYRVPDREPDREGDSGTRSGQNRTVPEPVPLPVSPDGEKILRADVEAICQHLADRIAEDGSKRPTITEKWRQQARLLLDADGRNEQEVHAAIDWCQSHQFWRSNILSMPKLRERYDQLRKQAMQERNAPASTRPADVINRAAVRMGGEGISYDPPGSTSPLPHGLRGIAGPEDR